MHSSRELCLIVFYKVDHPRGECKSAFGSRPNVGIWRLDGRPRGRRPPGLFQYFLHSGTVRPGRPILANTAGPEPRAWFAFVMTFTTMLHKGPLQWCRPSVTKL